MTIIDKLIYLNTKKTIKKAIWKILSDKLRIPAYPDGETGSIRTLNREHPDTCRLI